MPFRSFRWRLFAFCKSGLTAFHLAVLGLESSLILHKDETGAIQSFNSQLQGTGIQQLVSPGTTRVLEYVGIQFPLAAMAGVVLAVMLVVRIAAAKVAIGFGQERVLELTHAFHAAGSAGGGGEILQEQRGWEGVGCYFSKVREQKSLSPMHSQCREASGNRKIWQYWRKQDPSPPLHSLNAISPGASKIRMQPCSKVI